MKFALDEIEKGATFTRGQELDAERAALMPRNYVGGMLSREEAARDELIDT
jgi:hypothetical protein